MSTFYEKGSELIKKGQELIKNSRDIAIKKSERVLKIERIKTEIQSLKNQKVKHLEELSRKAYELYTQNNLTNPEMISVCQDIKTLQWQIDEKWTEINNLKSQKD